MKILELFSGTECLSNAFRARGHQCFTVVMADALRPKPVRWEHSPYSVVKAWQDRMQNYVIYPSSEILD